MEINGKILAEDITASLHSHVDKLLAESKTPKLAIVAFQGSEAAWGSYVKAKVKFAEKIGVAAEVIRLQTNNLDEFEKKLADLNSDSSYQGVIIQRPLPDGFYAQNVVNAVAPNKDVDGFRIDSKFEPPLWLAVKYILEYIANHKKITLGDYLKNKSVVVIGKGETGGQPVIKGFTNFNINPIVVDSKTPRPEDITRKADIIVCTVGRHVLDTKNIKNGVILIGVGMHRAEDSRLHGDYEVSEVKKIASYYTPIPGGVGPINVAFLFYNLLEAAENT